MSETTRRLKPSATRVERLVAASVVVFSIVLAAVGVWVFRAIPGAPSSSLPRLILSDRATLGFVRLLVAVGSLYGLASVAVLVTRGRWVRSFSTSGIETDAADDFERTIRFLEADLAQARTDKERAERLLSEVSDG